MAFWRPVGDNFAQVTSTIWRSAQPSSNRLIELHAKFGILRNLNLRDNLDAEEGAEVKAAGMTFINIAMRDDVAPDPLQVAFVVNLLRDGIPTLVNCKGGRHRTGLIIACYRVAVEGWDKRRAWDEAYKFNFYRWPGNHGPIEDWFLNTFTGRI